MLKEHQLRAQINFELVPCPKLLKAKGLIRMIQNWQSNEGQQDESEASKIWQDVKLSLLMAEKDQPNAVRGAGHLAIEEAKHSLLGETYKSDLYCFDDIRFKKRV